MKKSIVFISLLFMSCSSSPFKEYDVAIQKSIDKSLLYSTEKILVIPRAGCGSCIDEASYFAITNYKKFKNTIIILTVIEDYKRLSQSLGKEFLKYESIKIDSNNYLQQDKIKSNYPYVLSLKNGKVIEKLDFESGKRQLF